jgi:hypothetical protein
LNPASIRLIGTEPIDAGVAAHEISITNQRRSAPSIRDLAAQAKSSKRAVAPASPPALLSAASVPQDASSTPEPAQLDLRPSKLHGSQILFERRVASDGTKTMLFSSPARMTDASSTIPAAASSAQLESFVLKPAPSGDESRDDSQSDFEDDDELDCLSAPSTPPRRHRQLFPSDHFGLCAVIDVVQI